jgi:hypothetical protein
MADSLVDRPAADAGSLEMTRHSVVFALRLRRMQDALFRASS